MKECELLSIAWQKFTELGSEWTQCANIVCSGPYTAPYRRFTSDRVIREGDCVVVDIGACFNGYWGDFTRTFIVRRRPAHQGADRSASGELQHAVQCLRGGGGRQDECGHRQAPE